MRIFVDEDSGVVAMLVEDTLSDGGHEVIGPATTSARALELAEQMRPDFALIDMNLADGPTGIGLAQELRRRWEVPSLIVSGQPIDARSPPHTALGHLRKPYLPDELLASIDAARKILNGQTPMIIPDALTLFSE